MSTSKTKSGKYDYVLPDHLIEYGVEVDINSLKIDPQAQRSLNEQRAQGIAKALVATAIGSLIVSRRASGEMYVVDGMHRRRAAQLCNWTKMTAEVHHGLTREQEAVLFLIKNRESKAPSPLDEFKVGVTAGVPLHLDIQAIFDKHDLIASTGPSGRCVSAIKGIETIVLRYGPETLDLVLTVAEQAWGRTEKTWDGTVLGGLGEFLGKHGDEVDLKRLVQKLESGGAPSRWQNRAAENMLALDTSGAAVSKRHGMYRAVKHFYNSGLRTASKKVV